MEREGDFGEMLAEMMFKLMNSIESQTDHREKFAGDKVKVWDGSANVDNKGRSRSGIDPLFKNETAILVRTDCDKKMNKRNYFGEEDREEVLDCEIYFPGSDVTVWTKLKYLQLADFEPLTKE